MEILIVKLAALGDVLRTTSLLRPLRARHPKARIAWITAASALPLLENNPLIDETLALDDADAAQLAGRFDLVLSLEEDARAAALAAAACRGELVGIFSKNGALAYTPASAGYYDMSLLNRDPDGGHARADALKAANTLTYAELWLRALGLDKPPREDLRPILMLAGEDRRAARELARRHGIKAGGAIGLNPGAGGRWPAKALSPEKTARLVQKLGSLGRPILLLGGGEEKERNAEIAALARTPSLINAGSAHGLRSFAGIIELCGLLVTTDSLAFHIATALGVKTLALVGPTSACELDVFGRGQVMTPREPCRCFYRPRCQFPESCLDLMPEEDLVSAARGELA